MKRNVPGPLWIALVVMGIAAVATLFSGSHHSLLKPVVTSACDVALLVGLFKGQKWAYILTMVAALLGTVVAFGKSPTLGIGALIGNALVVIPVLICTPFFFPSEAQEENT